MNYVVLLTAGIGSRMGKYSTVTNKSLLPVKDKALISHLVEQFTHDTKYVVALGYKGDLVREYLEMAHYDRDFTFVNVDKYLGPECGPAYSLKQCRPYLPGGFTAMACDGFFSNIKDYLDSDNNWIGVANIDPNDSPAYCNVESFNDKVLNLVDKTYCASGEAFSGIFHVKDHEQFWDKLGSTELSSALGSMKLVVKRVPWKDLGTYDKYQSVFLDYGAYDFSKNDEFLYIVNGQVIKFFMDERIVENRIKRASLKPDVFPAIKKRTRNFYSYDFVPGKTLYEHNNADIFASLLEWLHNDVWPTTGKQLSAEHCVKFYKDKTLSRLKLFRDKYPDFNPSVINGKPIHHTMEELIADVNWKIICERELEERTSFFHGDLQFDNILYDGSEFTLIDWRQDFAGQVEVGDKYYDLAKLIGGMIINYDYIKKNLFTLYEDGDAVFYEYAQRTSKDTYLRILSEFVKDPDTVNRLIPIIFLNMAPLHAAPWDKMLFCMALEYFNTDII